MILAGLLNKIFGLTNKQVDYFASIFAAVIISSGEEFDEKMEKGVEEDAVKLFKDKTLQGFFVSQVEFLVSGGAKGIKDLNALIKIINKNSKLHKKWNAAIPYDLLRKYMTEGDLQKRVFEFLHTIKAEEIMQVSVIQEQPNSSADFI